MEREAKAEVEQSDNWTFIKEGRGGKGRIKRLESNIGSVFIFSLSGSFSFPVSGEIPTHAGRSAHTVTTVQVLRKGRVIISVNDSIKC